MVGRGGEGREGGRDLALIIFEYFSSPSLACLHTNKQFSFYTKVEKINRFIGIIISCFEILNFYPPQILKMNINCLLWMHAFTDQKNYALHFF